MDQLIWSLAVLGRTAQLNYKSQIAFSFQDLFSAVLTHHGGSTCQQNDWPLPRLDREKVRVWELTDSNQILRVEFLGK